MSIDAKTTSDSNSEYVARSVAESGATSGEIRVECTCQDGQGQDKTLCINVDKGAYVCKRCDIKGNYLKKKPTEKKPLAEYIWNHALSKSSHPYVSKKQIHPNVA